MIRRGVVSIVLRPQYKFGVMSSIKSTLMAGSIYRAIAIVAGGQIGATLFSNYFIDKGVIMPIEDYLNNTSIKENEKFQVAGIIKPGSIDIKRGTLDVKFILTNFEDDLTVIYKGETKFEFKEGETLVLTAYVPDKKQRKKLIGIGYLTKHSMDGNQWQDQVGVDNNSFGLNSRAQAQM